MMAGTLKVLSPAFITDQSRLKHHGALQVVNRSSSHWIHSVIGQLRVLLLVWRLTS